MSKTKRILAIVLALAVALCLSITAFAADITIDNAQAGKTYSVYKVFDLVTDTSGSETIQYYTYSGYNSTFLQNIQAADSPFAVYDLGGSVYKVMLANDADADDVATFLKANVNNLGIPDHSDTAVSDGPLVLSTYTDGYFFIDTNSGAAVTISGIDGDITVVDKNSNPGPVPADPTDPTDAHYKYIEDENGDLVTAMSADVGSEGHFTLTCFATHYDGETKVLEYVAHDIPGWLGAELTIMNAEIEYESGTYTLSENSDYYVNTNSSTGEMEITIPWVDGMGEFLYPDNSTIVIELVSSIFGHDNDHINRGYFTWTNNNDAPSDDVSDVNIYSHDIIVTAIDPVNDIYLEGSYVLKNSNDEYYALDYDNGVGGVVYWTSDISEAYVAITNDMENVFSGLADGTYYIEEAPGGTPDGYNALENPYTVTINNANANAELQYGTGNDLPATGAAGTIALIAIGSLIAIGAGLFLVTNMRMKKEDILG